MRIGSNPEKFKRELTRSWLHRVIIPVYIPNSEDGFYKESFDVFKNCIESLLLTINSEQTAITIINNNCSVEVSNYIEDLLSKDDIQKHVKYSTNVGKTYAILSEAKSCYEEFLTISDADVYFIKGWVEETAKIFNNYKYVGMVSPLPAPTFYKFINKSCFVRNLFKIKLDKVVEDRDFDLFMKGVNPSKNFFDGKKWNWKEKQFYLEKNKVKSCVGALHFIATYKKSTFIKIPLNPTKYKFKGGDEIHYIEKFIDRQGYFRLSTIKTFAYHMGNKLEDLTFLIQSNNSKSYPKIHFNQFVKNKDYIPNKYFLISIVFSAIKNIYKSN